MRSEETSNGRRSACGGGIEPTHPEKLKGLKAHMKAVEEYRRHGRSEKGPGKTAGNAGDQEGMTKPNGLQNVVPENQNRKRKLGTSNSGGEGGVDEALRSRSWGDQS